MCRRMLWGGSRGCGVLDEVSGMGVVREEDPDAGIFESSNPRIFDCVGTIQGLMKSHSLRKQYYTNATMIVESVLGLLLKYVPGLIV